MGGYVRVPRIILLLMVAGVLVACGSDDSGGESNDNAVESEAPEETDSEPEDEGAGGPAQSVEVTAEDFSFEPTELSVDPGAEVTVSLTNDGNTTHTFTAEDVELDIQAPAGASTEGTFTAPDSGSIDYVCTFHPSMKGTITVGGGGGAGSGGGEGEKDDSGTDNPNY